MNIQDKDTNPDTNTPTQKTTLPILINKTLKKISLNDKEWSGNNQAFTQQTIDEILR